MPKDTKPAPESIAHSARVGSSNSGALLQGRALFWDESPSTFAGEIEPRPATLAHGTARGSRHAGA
eukprot:4369552-Pleurochrysis_carterae.AAC.2